MSSRAAPNPNRENSSQRDSESTCSAVQRCAVLWQLCTRGQRFSSNNCFCVFCVVLCGFDIVRYTEIIFRSYLDRRLSVARDDALRAARNRPSAPAPTASASGAGGPAAAAAAAAQAALQAQSKSEEPSDYDADDSLDEQFADGSGLEEQLQAVSAVARLSGEWSLAMLSACVHARTQQLVQFAALKQAQKPTGVCAAALRLLLSGACPPLLPSLAVPNTLPSLSLHVCRASSQR
jgi:hypothetical protein